MDKPRLCFIGNLLGRNAGYITTQGQILADLFAGEGFTVTSSSSKINRALRLLDIGAAIIKNRNNIDVLILDVFSGQSFVIAETASFICKLLRIPLIAVLRGGNLPVFIKKYPRWTRRVLERADILVAPSHFLAEEIGKSGFEIRVVPNIIDIENYPFKLRKRIAPKLIWMRSFHPLYNPKMALEVLVRLTKTHPEATLVMAGADKGLEAEMKKTAQILGLKEKARFPGFLTIEEKAREFAEADIYINTNHIDNMPVSVVEACAFGLPVIATDVGGISYLLSEGETALLVEDDNADEMARAARRLLDDENLTEKISKNGRLLAEKSAWKSVRREWEEMFSEIIGVRQNEKTVVAAARASFQK
jgi:glycosyltransferase involved in cell wall biosynthesis